MKLYLIFTGYLLHNFRICLKGLFGRDFFLYSDTLDAEALQRPESCNESWCTVWACLLRKLSPKETRQSILTKPQGNPPPPPWRNTVWLSSSSRCCCELGGYLLRWLVPPLHQLLKNDKCMSGPHILKKANVTCVLNERGDGLLLMLDVFVWCCI